MWSVLHLGRLFSSYLALCYTETNGHGVSVQDIGRVRLTIRPPLQVPNEHDPQTCKTYVIVSSPAVYAKKRRSDGIGTRIILLSRASFHDRSVLLFTFILSHTVFFLCLKLPDDDAMYLSLKRAVQLFRSSRILPVEGPAKQY